MPFCLLRRIGGNCEFLVIFLKHIQLSKTTQGLLLGSPKPRNEEPAQKSDPPGSASHLHRCVKYTCCISVK